MKSCRNKVLLLRKSQQAVAYPVMPFMVPQAHLSHTTEEQLEASAPASVTALWPRQWPQPQGYKCFRPCTHPTHGSEPVTHSFCRPSQIPWDIQLPTALQVVLLDKFKWLPQSLISFQPHSRWVSIGKSPMNTLDNYRAMAVAKNKV